MHRKRKNSAGLLIAGIVAAALAGCGTPYAPPIHTPDKDALAENTEVFAAGYRGITERYIDQVAVAEIALEGLRGFGSIDPALTVEHKSDRVTLMRSGLEVESIEAPGKGDVRNWAEATARLIEAAKGSSGEMRESSQEKVFEAVFDGALSHLDVFSRYAGAKEASRNRAKRDGFGGIGIRFKLADGAATVTEVMAHTPADEGGLKKGDRITHVDGEPLRGLKAADVVDRMRGPTHTKVVLTVEPPKSGPQRKVTLTRAHIVPVTVTASRTGGVLVLKITGFNQNTARAMENHLKEAKRDMGPKFKGVVLDLRGNPGGLLKQSVKISDLLLTQGHIVSTKGRHPDSLHHYEAGGRDLADGKPVMVLIDGKSASAAEIVAAALQDRDRAVLIGTSSYGKGTVQTVIRLPNDGEITLTWSRLLAPSGYVLHGLGVRPTVCTSSTDDAGAAVDRVLEKGLDLRSTFETWRTPGLRDAGHRNNLRDTCPSERRKTDLELDVARMMLENPVRYEKALALPSGSSEARN